MEIVSIAFRFIGRLFGFTLVFGILAGAVYLLSPLWDLEYRLVIFGITLAFLAAWFIYDRMIGSLAGDIAIVIRLFQVRSAGLVDGIRQYLGQAVEMRRLPEIVETQDKTADWYDVEHSPRVRRRLSKDNKVICLLGQKDAEPQYIDIGDVGAVYISAPQRTGKTNLIIQMISSLVISRPLVKKEIDFYFIDITRDLSLLKPLGKYTNNMKDAHKMMLELCAEIERRNQLRERFELGGGYWWQIPASFKITTDKGVEVEMHRPKPAVLVIDEAIQVLQEGKEPIKEALSKIINIGHKNGVLVIATTLYTRGDLIPTEFTALMRAKIVGYMGTDQAYLNVLGDYYKKHEKTIDAFVNQPYHFAMCIRPHAPSMFRPIRVPEKRLLELIQEAVVDVDDWREVALTIWWNVRGDISSEELARKTREFIELHGDGAVKIETIHKKSILELLRHAVQARIAYHHGQREKYTLRETVTSYGVMMDLFDSYCESGGFDKRTPTGEEMLKLKEDNVS